MITRNCLQCNDSFEVRASEVARGWGKFCSNKCKDSYSSTRPHLKGENHPQWTGGLNKLQKQEVIVGRKRPEQCELCGSIGVICYDHNHKTGEFRGWICQRCNLTLGFVKDNSELLFAMIDYIKNNGAGRVATSEGVTI